MTFNLIPPGARLESTKAGGFITHRGVALPGNRVLHSTPERGEHIAPLRDFSKGQPIRYRTQAPKQAAFTVQRAYQIARNPKPYRPAMWNCEHTEAVALGVQPASPQAQFWVGLLAVGAIVYVASRS